MTSYVQNLNSNLKNKKNYLCRLPNGVAKGTAMDSVVSRHLCHELSFATCQAAIFATSFSLPPARQSAKDVFVDCFSLPPAKIIGQSAKRMFADCLVFGRWQSILAVGKAQFSCSECFFLRNTTRALLYFY